MAMSVLAKQKSPLNVLAGSITDAYAANFWLQKFNPLWSLQQALGKVVQKQQASADMVSLTLLVNRHFQMGDAGQHHPVYVVVNGIRYERTYSLTRLDAAHVVLTVKKVQQGIVSQWLANKTQIGDILEFGQPYGDMTLAENITQPLVLLAAGSGITPMVSILKRWSKQTEQQPIHLMYWVKQYADAAFKAYFEELAQQHAAFSFEIFYTQEQQDGQRIHADQLARLPHLAQSTVYACGAAGFVSAAEACTQSASMFKGEAFSMGEMVNDELGFVNITLTQSKQVITIPKGQSILSSLEQQNIKPQHGCRMGICNKCACHKVEGSTKNLVNGQQNTEPGNLLKICVNSAQTDLVIDL